MATLKVLTKTEVNSLQYLSFNRKFSVRKDLVDNMNRYGFVVPIIIIQTDLIDGDKKSKFIVDGQFRSVAATFLGKDMLAVIHTSQELGINNLTELVQYVSSLNSSQRPWKLIDFAQAFNFLNYNGYKTLLTYVKNTPYPISAMGDILMGPIKGSSSRHIKAGSFAVKELTHTDLVVRLASKLTKFRPISGRMLIALSYVMKAKNFDEKKFIENFKKNCGILKELKLDDFKDIFLQWIK